jgi:hypothetical protein
MPVFAETGAVVRLRLPGRAGTHTSLTTKITEGGRMSKLEPAGSAERIAETAETLTWLTDLVQRSSEGDSSSHAGMADVLSLARSYVVEFAVHRSLGASDLEAANATARRDLNIDAHPH